MGVGLLKLKRFGRFRMMVIGNGKSKLLFYAQSLVKRGEEFYWSKFIEFPLHYESEGEIKDFVLDYEKKTLEKEGLEEAKTELTEFETPIGLYVVTERGKQYQEEVLFFCNLGQ